MPLSRYNLQSVLIPRLQRQQGCARSAIKFVSTQLHVYVKCCESQRCVTRMLANVSNFHDMQATSGYVFCYLCILRHLQQDPHCPVTLAPASVEDLVRVYDDGVSV